MSDNKMREAFEKDNPVPKGVIFDVSRNDYTFMRLTTEPAHPQTVHHYRRDWHVWQRAWNVLKSQQPESEPVAEALEINYGGNDRPIFGQYVRVKEILPAGTKLYTSPQPSAQVPKKIPVPEPILYGPVLDNADQIGYAEGWNSCVDAIIAPSIAEIPKIEAESDTDLEPCPFCGNPAREIMGLIGCEPCAIARRDVTSWNRRAAPSIKEKPESGGE